MPAAKKKVTRLKNPGAMAKKRAKERAEQRAKEEAERPRTLLDDHTDALKAAQYEEAKNKNAQHAPKIPIHEPLETKFPVRVRKDFIEIVFGVKPAVIDTLYNELNLPKYRDGSLNLIRVFRHLINFAKKQTREEILDIDCLTIQQVAGLSGIVQADVQVALKEGMLKKDPDTGGITAQSFRRWFVSEGGVKALEEDIKLRKLEAETKLKEAQYSKISKDYMHRKEHQTILHEIAKNFHLFWEKTINNNLHRFENKTREQLNSLMYEFGIQLTNKFLENANVMEDVTDEDVEIAQEIIQENSPKKRGRKKKKVD